MYFFLMIMWVVLAAAFFAWSWLGSGTHPLQFSGTATAAGWIALLFAFYNLVRWWTRRRLLQEKKKYQNPLLKPRRDEDGLLSSKE